MFHWRTLLRVSPLHIIEIIERHGTLASDEVRKPD